MQAKLAEMKAKNEAKRKELAEIKKRTAAKKKERAELEAKTPEGMKRRAQELKEKIKRTKKETKQIESTLGKSLDYLRMTPRQKVHYFYNLSEEERAQLQEELQKAEAKGGTYHRRVTNDKGKHRYYYNPDDYSRSKDAHVDGAEAASKYIQKTVRGRVEKAGDAGCPIEEMKDLVKRYGSDKVGDALKDATTNGGMTFKAKKLYLNKSEQFVMEMKR
jgi:hypothetical protein